jgi:DNA repair protein RecN (Recombination protein N)
LLRRLRIENLVLIREAELELAPGLNAITGETGAGKTILAQALGMLLGSKVDDTAIGPAAAEVYVEAELDLPDGLLEEEGFEALADLRPEGEDTLVLARRVFADGRTRAYAWGRSVAREDVAAAAERLVAMSGQFEQRRLARPSFQLAVLDGYAGAEEARAAVRTAWRSLGAARQALAEAEREAENAGDRLAELRAIVEDAGDFQPGEEEALRTERERVRHVAELGEGVSAAASALAPDEGEGAAGLVAHAERAILPLTALAPELGQIAEELRDVDVRLREAGADLRGVLDALEADPARLQEIEERLDAMGAARRRFAYTTYEELLERVAAAREELDARESGADPLAEARRAAGEAERAWAAAAKALHRLRATAAGPFADAVSERLASLGVGAGEFAAELTESEPGPSGTDTVSFLVRPNPGLQLAPAAQTASGGELSRIALAIAAVAGGDTMVFDEIDAGIGGQTAHAVAGLLEELAAAAQVVTITHLPQIASRAQRHFRVEKVPGDPTHTRIEPLEEDERQAELERMLGGREFIASVATGGAG